MFHFVTQKCDASNSGTLEGSEIKHFYDLLTQREEIDVIYGDYAQTEGQMSAGDLLGFLLREQREQVSMQDALKLIEKYEVDETGGAEFYWSRRTYCAVFSPSLSLSVLWSTSQAAEAHDQRRLPEVHEPGGRLHLQPGPQTGVSGHAPAPQPLLHLLLAQHIPDGGPTQRTQQHRSLHKVTAFTDISYVCV